MKTKHTPGPWYAAQSRNEDCELDTHIYSGDQQIRIAVVEQWNGTAESVESEANARLIASAPELLAALQGVLNYPDCVIDYERFLLIRAVLAKATSCA